MKTSKSKKTKKKTKPAAPMTFKQLLGRVLKHEAAHSLIKAAVQTGWLTDEDFLTRLTPEEVSQVREVYDSEPAYKRAKAADVAGALPEVVGPLADEHNVAGDKARLTSGERTVHVDARLFLTMKKRHPNACVYLSHDDPESNPVIFSEKTTVAVLPVIV